MISAIRHLLQNHEEIGKLFNHFVDAGNEVDWHKQFIADRVIQALTVHIELEEKILFPAYVEKGGDDAEEMVLEGIEEHQIMGFMMSRLEDTLPDDKTFNARFEVLMKCSQHHFLEEEHDLFPKVKRVLEDELYLLGEEMEALAKQMKKGSQSQELSTDQ